MNSRVMNYVLNACAVLAIIWFMGACNKPVAEERIPTPTHLTFTKPVIIVVDTTLNSSSGGGYNQLISMAGELSIEIVFIKPVNLHFNLSSGQPLIIPAHQIKQGMVILFDGKTYSILPSAYDFNELKQFYGFTLPVPEAAVKAIKPVILTNVKESDFRTRDTLANIQPVAASFVKGWHKPNQTISGKLLTRNPVLDNYLWLGTKVEVLLDNDLFCNTDRYYTNGIHIKYQSPGLAFWRINNLLPVGRRKSIEYNSLELHHGMYTPFTTKKPPTLINDRPYASTLFLRFARTSVKPVNGIIQTASLDVGIIGKMAMGSLLQQGVHAGLPSNDEPLGWETEIANDLILNYHYKVTCLMASLGYAHFFHVSEASLGTLHTSVSSGLGIKVSSSKLFVLPLPHSFSEMENMKPGNWKVSFETTCTPVLVGYNATLNGGMLNKKNVFVLNAKETQRLLVSAEAKITLNYRKVGLVVAQSYLSKEFKEGKEHFWGTIGLQYGI